MDLLRCAQAGSSAAQKRPGYFLLGAPAYSDRGRVTAERALSVLLVEPRTTSSPTTD